MNQKIIDDINKLLGFSDDELNEVLLDDKYNKANLRELVRRVLFNIKEYKNAFEYERHKRLSLEEKLY